MKAYKCKCDSCGEVFSSPEMYLSHRTCPVAAIAARDAVIRELVACMQNQEKRETGEFHWPAHSFKPVWDEAITKALALIGGGEKWDGDEDERLHRCCARQGQGCIGQEATQTTQGATP